MADDKVREVLSKVNRRRLRNNTQKVLFSLAKNGGWVARTALRVPSVGSRIRDLRKEQFGGFAVECATPAAVNRSGASVLTKRQTFYRIVPRTITLSALRRVLKGVI